MKKKKKMEKIIKLKEPKSIIIKRLLNLEFALSKEKGYKVNYDCY